MVNDVDHITGDGVNQRRHFSIRITIAEGDSVDQRCSWPRRQVITRDDWFACQLSLEHGLRFLDGLIFRNSRVHGPIMRLFFQIGMNRSFNPLNNAVQTHFNDQPIFPHWCLEQQMLEVNVYPTRMMLDFFHFHIAARVPQSV